MESKINLFIQFFAAIFSPLVVVLASAQFADQSPLLLQQQQHINHSISFFLFEFNILCMSAHT